MKNFSFLFNFTLGIAYVFSGAKRRWFPDPLLSESRLGVGSTTRIIILFESKKIKSYLFNGPGKIKLHCQVSSVMATKTYLQLERFKVENTEVKYAIFLYNWDTEATIHRTPLNWEELKKIFISPARWCLIHSHATGNGWKKKKTNFIKWKFRKMLF